MSDDKPVRRSLAVTYALKKRSQGNYAKGGCAVGKEQYAEGGSAVGKENYAHGGGKRIGYSDDTLPCGDCQSGHCRVHGANMMEHGGDVVDRIMNKGAKKLSEGGRIANQEHGQYDDDLADFSPNEFDDLVLRDDLEQNYTGENSGDELGSEQEDADRHDIVARVMRSQGKKDRNLAGYGVSHGNRR